MPRSGELWRHWNGSLYRVVGLVRREADRAELVVYRLADDGRLPEPVFWCRPLAEWEEPVPHLGGAVPRFARETPS